MKKITLNFGIIICSSIFSVATHAQTNVIALKSHAGEMADVLERDDNFGIIDPRYEYSAIDSVKYDVKTKSIVNYRNYGNDTISYLNLADTIIQEHLKSIRLNGWYPKTIPIFLISHRKQTWHSESYCQHGLKPQLRYRFAAFKPYLL